EASGDLKQEALDTPNKLQDTITNALRARLGCAQAAVAVVSVGALTASLAVLTLTQAPPPFRLLGVQLTASATAGTPTPEPPPTPEPAATALPTATPEPHVQFSVSPRHPSQTCPFFASTLDPLTITLDNSQSNVAMGWQVSITDRVPQTSTTWATATPTSGEVP